MDLSDVIAICRAWNKLGWAVQAQAESVLDGQDLEEQNPNALDMIAEFFTEVAETARYNDRELEFAAEVQADRITTYLNGAKGG